MTTSSSASGPLLVAGGASDPNVRALLAAAHGRNVPVCTVLVGEQHDPWMAWDLSTDTLTVDGELIRPAAAFVRHDVFAQLADGRSETAARALGWYQSVTGWILAHDEVRSFNRATASIAVNKAHVLCLAAGCGLAIPRTLVSNHKPAVTGFLDGAPKVAKPVGGGGLCKRLDDALSTAGDRGGVVASPAIVQEELVPPELRVYGIRGRFFAFDVRSPELDYRASQSATLSVAEVPTGIEEGLARLMAALGLDFAAADFKTRGATTGDLCFLEINTAPMFAAFDATANGALTGAMLDWLVGPA